MHRFLQTLALLLFLSVGLASCGESGPPPEELIAKSWKLQKLNIQGQMVPPQIMVNSSFNFHKNGRYEIEMGSVDKGTWHLSEDKKILVTINEETHQEQHIDILQLEPELLILNNPAGPSPVRMELVPL